MPFSENKIDISDNQSEVVEKIVKAVSVIDHLRNSKEAHAKILRELQEVPGLQIDRKQFSDIEKIVSRPATLTHVTKQPAFWLGRMLGVDIPINKERYDEGGATSIHVTDLEGKNWNIRGADYPWAMVEKDGSPTDNALIVFSKIATEKVGGYPYISDKDFIAKEKLFRKYRDMDFAKYLEDAFGVSYDRPSKPSGSNALIILLAESVVFKLVRLLSLKKKNSDVKDDLEYVQQRISGKRVYGERVSHGPERLPPDYGSRFRGIKKVGNKLVWTNLDPQPEDIAAIYFPLEAGKLYARIKRDQ